MLKEFVQYLIEQTTVEELEVGGRTYTSRGVNPVKPPVATAVVFNTLSGFAEFAIGQGTEDRLVHVVSPSTVMLISAVTDEWEQRDTFATATTAQHGESFPFGTYLDPEAFIIGLQAQFVPTPHREEVLRLAGNLSAQASIDVEDDGVTQSVGQKSGVVLKSRATLPPQIVLAPWRTFREAKQPESTFIVRAKQERDGAMPKLALFDADGGAWKLQAIKEVAVYLKSAMPGFTVLA